MKFAFKHIFILFFLAGAAVSSGQQIPLYSQYYLNPFVYNPAAAGFENYSKLFVFRKDQWTSFAGRPINNSVTFDTPVKDGIGLGISLHNETRGISARTGIYGYCAYKVKFSAKSRLAFGLSLGMINNRLDFSKALVQNAISDPLISSNQANTFPDSRAGILLTLQKFEFGISSLQLTANLLQKDPAYENMRRHFYFSSKYIFTIHGEKGITAYPYLLAKAAPGNLFQYDASFVLDWKDKGWIAASYRQDYAVGVYGGVKLFKKLRIGYAYDLITNPLMSYSGLSHEIVVGYVFPDPETRKYYKEIREISRKLKKRGDSIVSDLLKCYERKEKAITKEELEKIDQEIEKFRRELKKLEDAIDKKPE